VTACTRGRARHFNDPAAVAVVVDALVETASQYRITIVVYLAMPDHLHILVDGDDEGSEFAVFMKIAKQRSGFRFKQRFGVRLWQDG
jgi:REP element-mobilizing transposase RayT